MQAVQATSPRRHPSAAFAAFAASVVLESSGTYNGPKEPTWSAQGVTVCPVSAPTPKPTSVALMTSVIFTTSMTSVARVSHDSGNRVPASPGYKMIPREIESSPRIRIPLQSYNVALSKKGTELQRSFLQIIPPTRKLSSRMENRRKRSKMRTKAPIGPFSWYPLRFRLMIQAGVKSLWSYIVLSPQVAALYLRWLT